MISDSASTRTGRWIAWRRAREVRAGETLSLMHIVRTDAEGYDLTPRTLCGVQPRWAYEQGGDGRRCARCCAIAGLDDLRDAHGQALGCSTT